MRVHLGDQSMRLSVKLARTFLCAVPLQFALIASASNIFADEVAASDQRKILRVKPSLEAANFFCSDPALHRAPLDPDLIFVWTGRCENNLLEGSGVLSIYDQGPLALTLTGTFVHGAAEGRQIIEYARGDKFDGEFHGNQPNGHGKYVDPRGTSMEGEFRDDMLEGVVLTVTSDQTVITSSYRDGEAEGPDTIRTPHSYRMDRTFRSGKLDGPETFSFPGGDRMTVNFTNGIADTAATYVTPDGQSIHGDFVPARLDPTQPHAPRYPLLARRLNLQGVVKLEVMVSANGQVEYARVAESSGWTVLDQAARESALTWHYLPATVDKRPVPSVRDVTLPFAIRGPDQPPTN